MSEQEALVNESSQFHRSRFIGTLRPCMAEFLGTTLFVFLGTMATNSAPPLIAVAVAHGLGLAVLVSTMAVISGAHFNPAVTLGVCLSGEIAILKAFFYIISQLLGGIVGAALTRAALPYSKYLLAFGGGHKLGDDVSVGEGIACEVFLTAVLVLVVLLVAVDNESQRDWAPLAIGFSVGADILAGGAISGASMNPARSFGPAVVASTAGEISSDLWKIHYVYWVGPALGACFAALWYRLIFAAQGKNLLTSRFSYVNQLDGNST